MASERFDEPTRNLSSGSSRRTVIAGMASGLAALLPLAPGGDSIGAKKKRKRKKKCKCPICQRCLGNRCIPAQDDTPCRDCGRCNAGVCAIPLLQPEPPCGPCATCESGGVCVPNAGANNTPCNGDGRCLYGTCNPKPTCDPAGSLGCFAVPPCCSGQCCYQEQIPFCCASGLLEPCYDSGDCGPDLDCVGYRCLQ